MSRRWAVGSAAGVLDMDVEAEAYRGEGKRL